ncbi:WD repeat-containing protein 27 isoform X6 [Acanthopagrus latus]|uniref:WD repeat-containing protein 27 isoform X6 n=1 Tax=Acanthopagrus latus TaxID=8177 RepID=UPI00187CC3B8|nr:WD repeat-containing protein 27 isoform X6 [Acanthopagrus latus]
MIEKLSLTCDGRLSHRQLACCHSYCGLPLDGKDMLIYSNVDKKLEPLLLTGHHGEISAMTFGKGSRPVLLCSASADYIIVWDIELCQKRTQEGKVAAGTVIGTSLGEVVHLAFCLSDERVAACSGATVYVLSSKRPDVISTLTSHLGPLTSAEFCPWNKDILVTTSEDRTFKVWDLKTETVCYQSFVLSASPLLSVLFLEENRHLITGSTDGQVWCFTLPDDHKCHLVTKMDLQKMEKRHQMHQLAISYPTGCAEQSTVDKVETSKPVLKMASCSSLTDTRSVHEKNNSWLCIGSSDGLYVVDLATSELLRVLYFKDYHSLSITLAGSWSISSGWDNSMVFLVSSLFTPCVVLLELCLSELGRNWACGEGLSVYPSSPLLPESPLNVAFKKKEPNLPKKKGGIKEQPLVFHSKVRSSGYTSAPRRIMFSPKTNIQKKPSSKKATKNMTFPLSDYPADSAAPTIPHCHLSTGNKPVYCFQYSGDGKQILCGLGDSSVLLYKSSLTGNPTVYTGHGKSVSSVSWSLNRQWLLSASEDQSLRIWTHGSAEPAIVMGSMFSTQAPDSYNLFLTSAVTDGVKIWDLRTLRCVRRYENHVNRCHPCSSAISPCGRFIASGSEDNCAYVYDIRSSSYLHKLQKQADTVLSVTFNPATPQLLTGTLDGKLRLFQSSSGDCLSHDNSAAVHSIPNMTA